jgi:hypothetical protein
MQCPSFIYLFYFIVLIDWLVDSFITKLFFAFIYRYNGSTGRVGTWTMKLEPLPSSGKTEATPTEITEESVAPFFCPHGCGGQKKSIYDIAAYEKGHCQPHNTCK